MKILRSKLTKLRKEFKEKSKGRAIGCKQTMVHKLLSDKALIYNLYFNY